MKRHAPPHHGGFTLIEILVALLIFSFGLLGFVGLQARAIQHSVSAEDSNRAALLANEMGSTILLSSQSGAASAPDADVTAWKARVSTPASGGLPNGEGTVTGTGNTLTVTITWQPPSAASGAANSVNRYFTQVVVP
jgi:type IV pilus assembly protein PilV